MYPLINTAARTEKGMIESFSFKTTFNGSVSFSVSYSGSNPVWDMGDGTILNGTVVNHVYADSTEKTVTVSVNNISLLTGIGSFSAKQITEVDLSNLTHLSGTINFSNNINLTVFLQPASMSAPGAFFFHDNTNFAGVLDLSNMIFSQTVYIYNLPNATQVIFNNSNQFVRNFRAQSSGWTGNFQFYGIQINQPIAGGTCWLSNCPDITTITHNPNPQNTNSYTTENCANLTGNLDLSMMGIDTFFQFQNCPLLTGITHRAYAVSPSMDRYFAHGTGIINLDLSMLGGIGGRIRVFDCPDLETVNLGSSTKNLNEIWFYNNPKMLGLDFSNLSNIGGSMIIYGNDVATFYNFPAVASPNTLSILMYENNLLTSIDLSNVNIAGNIDLYENDILATISLPASSGAITRFRAFDNPVLTSLDLSGLSFASFVSSIEAQQCPLLTSFVPPTLPNGTVVQTFNLSGIGAVGVFALQNMNDYSDIDTHITNIQDNSYTTAEVNEMLVKFDSIAVGGFISRNFYIDGTNSAPDSSSGGFNGNAAKSSIQSKGYNVVTN